MSNNHNIDNVGRIKLNLVLTRNARNNRSNKETFLINIIESVIKENLPSVSSNYKDLIYTIEFSNNSLILKSYILGSQFKLNPTQLWEEGKLVIARCLPKFTNNNFSYYKDMLDIITTNSQSMIWLCDEIVDEKIKQEVYVESDKPLFTMCYDNIEEKVLVANFISEQNHLLISSNNKFSLEDKISQSTSDVLDIVQDEGCYSISET